jgi:flagellar P-ring protein precursor FlgI
MPLRHGAVVLLLVLLLVPAAQAQSQAAVTRLKELVTLEGTAPVQLTGYGLIVGLDRTGDRARGTRGSPYTVQSIVNMLERFGITVDPEVLAARNVAAVMVTALLDPFKGVGSPLDVTVSSLGDARSLSGGVLLQTPLIDPGTQIVYAVAQGPVSTSAVLASSLGSTVQINHTNTGRIPNGALVTRAVPLALAGSTTLGLALRRPDFTNALRIAEVINGQFAEAAQVEHAGMIRLNVPSGGLAAFMAGLENLNVQIDLPARVVINERTGTIVAGGNVKISQVMITYGSLIVATQEQPVISQPGPLSSGQTVATGQGQANIEEEGTRSVILGPNTDVSQLAQALNDLGLTARDVIAIFQAIDRAGALQGELVTL